MANTELRLFRYFVTLCEEQNFSRAAERLLITPPTLTHQIQKLEKELNVRLLNRKSRFQLTDAGERFLESARDVLHLAEQAEMTARKAARGEIGRLEIGYMIATAYSGLIQGLLRNFQSTHPGIEIRLHQVSTMGLINAIEANELDAGFAREPSHYPSAKITGFSFFRAPIILAIPGTHPLARGSGPINPKSLANEPFVSTSISYDFAFTRHVDAIGRLGNFKPTISKRAEDLTTVLSYVSLGYGIAAVSPTMANCHVPNVAYKKLASRLAPEVTYAFMYRANESAPATRSLIETMHLHALKHEEKSDA
jgi:DNA-binding transcriptional LysR family regulator